MYKIHHFSTIDSTNLYAMKNIDEYSDGDIVSADFQTAGRGRLGRVWSGKDPENLYMSIILKPESDYKKLPLANLTQFMSLIIVKTAEMFGIECKIKWPNDVFANDKKVAGILSETVFSGGNLKGLVLGFGINLNSYPSYEEINKYATSFSEVCGKKIDRNSFVFKLIEKFHEDYSLFIKEGFSLIRDDYIKRFLFLDRHITVDAPGGKISGRAVDINEEGYLVLESEGRISSVAAGDILE